MTKKKVTPPTPQQLQRQLANAQKQRDDQATRELREWLMSKGYTIVPELRISGERWNWVIRVVVVEGKDGNV